MTQAQQHGEPGPTALLAARGIEKAYGPVTVLRGIDFDVRPGEVHALLGENGAGKSTLVKILSGLIGADAGTLAVAGRPVRFAGVREAEAAGVVLIHQEFNLAEQLTVEQNMFLGRELRRGPLLDKAKMRALTREYLDLLACRAPVAARVATLSVADKQLLEIAKAASHEARVLILDEPTAVLTPQETRALFALIDRLKAQGVGIVFISHKLDEVERIADRITVLRDGQRVCTEPASALSQDAMSRLMVGRELGDLFPEIPPPAADAPVVLEARDVAVAGSVEQASFRLRRGEILGFAGLQGAGRTALMEAIVGLRPRAAGRLLHHGRPATFRSLAEAKAARIAYLTKDRKGKGLILSHRLLDNFSLLALDRFATPLIDRRRERARFDDACARFDVRAADRSVTAGRLSGGNQQKLLMAKVLEIDPQIVIIDEPTRGVDVGAKAQIYRFIADLVGQGRSVIVLSSEMMEIIGLSHRVAVMHNGVLSGVLDGEDINEQTIMRYAAGLETKVSRYATAV